MRLGFRPFGSLFCACYLLLEPLRAFDTPLSDLAVREAYFLGQRHDDSLAEFLNKYTQHLEAPQSGPHIASVSFFTPYALTAIHSSERQGYSAQQAQVDHEKTAEVVRVEVHIWLTATYGEYIVRPVDSRSGSNKGLQFRPADFWREFRVRVLEKDQMVIPVSADGQPVFRCGEDACDLAGATLAFEFPAEAFTADTATVVVTPPEGRAVSVDFEPFSLR
jgi:hypothetical protein